MKVLITVIAVGSGLLAAKSCKDKSSSKKTAGSGFLGFLDPKPGAGVSFGCS